MGFVQIMAILKHGSHLDFSSIAPSIAQLLTDCPYNRTWKIWHTFLL